MASVSGAYNSATSYTVTVTGMTVGQKYHLFIADLDTSGSTTGYYCRYTQTASSSSYTYNGTCGSAYSGYVRMIYLFCTGTTATSHSVGTKYQTSQFPTSYTEQEISHMPAWYGGGSYKVRLKRGAGVSSISFRVNGSTGTTYTVGSGSEYSEKEVGEGGYLYLTDIGYEADYTYPVIATDQTSTPWSQWTAINSSGGWSDHYVSAPSGSGTRIVNISAEYSPTHYYRVTAHANGGTFASGADIWSMSYSTTDSSVTFYLNTIATPTRSGYTLKGWAATATSTTVYGSSITFAVGSTSQSSPTVKEVYAVWEQETYSGYIRLGAGINSANIYADGALKATITDKVYHELLNLTTGMTIAVKGIGKASGYTRPYTFKFYTSATATTTTNTLEVDADEPSYSWLRARVYAEIVATKTSIAPFYWDSASTDAALIAKGKPVSNLTSARWNSLMAKIREVAEAEGKTFTYSSVSSGGTFYATEFNEARTGVLNLTGYGTLPAAQSAGGQVKASLLEGSGSLKAALNAAIDYYNS